VNVKLKLAPGVTEYEQLLTAMKSVSAAWVHCPAGLKDIEEEFHDSNVV